MFNIFQKKQVICLLISLLGCQILVAQKYEVISPNGLLKITINASSILQYSVSYHNIPLVSPSKISMTFGNGIVAGMNGKIKNTKQKKVNKNLPVLFGKNSSLTDHYNELIISFRENYALIVRAYDDGAAYRFQTAFEGRVIVNSEEANFNFPGDPTVLFPETPADMSNFERLYTTYTSISKIDANKYCEVPAMVSFPARYTPTPYKVVITESDLLDYPGMYLHRSTSNGLTGFWPKYPREVKESNNIYAGHSVLSRYDYLAKTTGSRLYPWRVLIVSADDKNLLNNELVYKLARPLEINDISWIKVGKSAWEWWHKAMLEDVSFPSGNDHLGFDLYKYYVDFASANKIEFMTLDAGWKESYLKRLCTYAKTKNVGIFVWTWSNMPVEDSTFCARMNSLGVSGLKVDFFDRDDQIAMNWREFVARRCADNRLMVLFHGCPKPTGLQRAYPNIVNYEGVRGAECNFWDRGSDPDYHLQFPFIRMLAGPLDYTPGSMRNTTKLQFTPVDKPNIIPSSMGTRSHELAMYVLFDQPLGFLCDAPTEYARYPDILDYLSRVPTVWNKTVPLEAKFGEYAIIAKQTGNDWYVSGMTNWTEREVNVNFSFLPEGIVYNAMLYRDSNTSNDYPTQYVCEKIAVTSQTQLKIKMAKGGGFAMRLSVNVDTGFTEIRKSSKF